MNQSRLVSLAVALALTLLSFTPSAALADQPQTFTRHTERSGVFASCDTVDVTFVASITARYLISAGDDGEPTREIRHVAFTGTLTGPGGTLPYGGHFTRTEDLLEARARFTGLRFQVDRPVGPPLVAAGIDAFLLDSTDDTRTAGRLPDTLYTDVCSELAPR